MENTVRMLSTLGLMGAMSSLSSGCEALMGVRVDADFAPTQALLKRLRDGEAADLAVQQISELKQVAGIEMVGPIPHDLQTPVLFSAGRMATAKNAEAADRLLRYLASPEVAPVLRQSGLEP